MHVVLVPTTSAAVGLKHVVYRPSLHAAPTEDQVLHGSGKQPIFPPSSFAAIRAGGRSLENDHCLGFLNGPTHPGFQCHLFLGKSRSDENTIPLVTPVSSYVYLFQVRYRAFKYAPFGRQIFSKRIRMDDVGPRPRGVGATIWFREPTEGVSDQAQLLRNRRCCRRSVSPELSGRAILPNDDAKLWIEGQRMKDRSIRSQ